jgi:methanogenic corrinoid protein MtbC1
MTIHNPAMKEYSEKLTEALLAIDRLTVKAILTQPYPNFSAYQIVEELVVPALESIGVGWESGVYSLSQVYMSGRLCEEMVDLILPPTDPSRRNQPKMAIVVLEDYHLLGKRIVYSVLRASGFEMLNYGHMDIETLVKRVLDDNIKILLVSVLMLPSALRVKELRARLGPRGAKIKIVVGGAPFRFDDQLWLEVGADAYGESAVEAVDIVHRMIEEIS